jgi:uncharacterized membrane protein
LQPLGRLGTLRQDRRTAEIFAISFWTTRHITTAGHTAGIAAIASFLTYVAHELAWSGTSVELSLCQNLRRDEGAPAALANEDKIVICSHWIWCARE